jgi:hypothetical protein
LLSSQSISRPGTGQHCEGGSGVHRDVVAVAPVSMGSGPRWLPTRRSNATSTATRGRSTTRHQPEWITLTVWADAQRLWTHRSTSGGDAVKETIDDPILDAAMRFGCRPHLWIGAAPESGPEPEMRQAQT